MRFRNILIYSKLQLERFPMVNDIATMLNIVREEAAQDESLKSLQKYNVRMELKTNSMFEPTTCLYKEFL
jgi:UDP-N-acetylglucosamine enolpyruvyl transferase